MSIKSWMDKQIMVYSYNGLLNSKKEWTIHISCDIDEYQNNYAEWPKSDFKKAHTIWFHFYKIVDIINWPLVTESSSVVVWGWWGKGGGRKKWEWITKGHQESSGGDRYVHYLTVVMVSYTYTYIKTYQIVYYKYVQFILCQLYT